MKLPFVRGVTRKCSLPSSSKWHRRPVSAHFHRGVSALSQTPNVLFPASGLRVNWAVVSSFLLSLSGYSRHETRVPSCVFTALLCLLRRRENKFRGHPKWISTNPDENLKRVKYLGGGVYLLVSHIYQPLPRPVYADCCDRLFGLLCDKCEVMVCKTYTEHTYKLLSGSQKKGTSLSNKLTYCTYSLSAVLADVSVLSLQMGRCLHK